RGITNLNFKGKTHVIQLKKCKWLGKWISWIVGWIVLLAIIGLQVLQWLINYILMDTLGFGKEYTIILTSKLVSGVSGIIFFTVVVSYVTVSWMRRVYVTHFGPWYLPLYFPNRKVSNWIMLGTAILLGAIGSLIVQGVGWEPALKLLKHVSFGKTDPFSNMDISFYVFILPFLKFIIYVLLGLSIFFLLAEIVAYSFFGIYRKSRL